MIRKSQARAVAASLLCLSLLLAAAPAAAQANPPSGLQRFTLDNGLEVFVLENGASPLVRVQLVFRAGAVAQTADNAGIFRLHEQMMSEGCERYRGPAELAAARTAMGVSDYDSETGSEWVSYYSVQPAGKLAQALDYWSSVFEKPLFESALLERARTAVLGEIGSGSVLLPQDKLFASYPWRKDVTGYPKAINKVTAEALSKLHASYFIPNNAALFVAGNVKADKALELAKTSFADWARGSADPWAVPPAAQAYPGVRRPTFVIKQDNSLSDGLVDVTMYYRGPDLAGLPKARTNDPKAAAAGLLWIELLNDPEGAYAKRTKTSIAGIRAGGAYFRPLRDGSLLRIWTRVSLEKDSPAWKTAMLGVKEQIRGAEMEAIRKGATAYFGAAELDRAKARWADARAMEANNLYSWVDSLGIAWASGGTEWITGLQERISALTFRDIEAFTDTWIAKNLEVVVLSLSPADYARETPAAKSMGFELADSLRSWWTAR